MAKVARAAPRSLAAILVALVLVEVALRVCEPALPALKLLLYHPQAQHGYRDVSTLEELLDRSIINRPFTLNGDFITNSNGFRTIEYAREKPAGTWRVLALGASFTYASGGVPYRVHWTTRLQEELQRHTDARVEVLNLGVPGVGVDFLQRLWELEGAHLDADLVVLSVPVGFLEPSVMVEELAPVARLALHCYVARVVRNVLLLERVRPELFQRRPATRTFPPEQGGRPAAEVLPDFEHDYDPLAPRRPRPAYSRVEARRGVVSDARSEPTRVFEKVYENKTARIGELHASAARSDAPLVVLVIPEVYQLDPEVREGMLHALGATAADLDLDRPQRRLRRFFEQAGIPFVDLLEPSRRAESEEGHLFHPRGIHWNALGNELAARTLADFVVETFPGPWRRDGR